MRILLADDQPKVRLALRLLLERKGGLSVVGEAADAEGVLAQAKAERPDLILLDWGLLGTAAADLLAALRVICPALSVIVLSGQLGVGQEALEAGADAFVSKMDPPERLLSALSTANRAEAKV